MLKKIKQILYRTIENREITYKKLQEMIKEKDCKLIDVRSKQEFTEGHLEGAISVPVYDLEDSIHKIILDKQNTVILYCTSGYRSKRAKEILERLGYENVYHLKNGLDGI